MDTLEPTPWARRASHGHFLQQAKHFLRNDHFFDQAKDGLFLERLRNKRHGFEYPWNISREGSGHEGKRDAPLEQIGSDPEAFPIRDVDIQQGAIERILQMLPDRSDRTINPDDFMGIVLKNCLKIQRDKGIILQNQNTQAPAPSHQLMARPSAKKT
ncbi:hypothetical protein [Microvirga rosea]|uniref:hypothetical protein n=1 Tax=Microvirga rosea TaxID=2715425 RepID=UPI001D0ACC4D|nr:hypothetical protein [Microvirga rosea]MCB8821661.1 hypothetical protein [Microvirga rosea]